MDKLAHNWLISTMPIDSTQRNNDEHQPISNQQLCKKANRPIYLADHETTLRNAMDNEQQSRELAAILHTGFPKMVQKIYSLAKFEKFFWEKRDLLHEYLAARFTSLEQQAAKKAK